MPTLDINVDAEPGTPLLIIHEQVGLTGTKYACGILMCGARTGHIDGRAVRSCSFPAGAATARKIATIEGLSRKRSHHKA